MNTNEEWRAVVGYEGFYEVSDQGRVRSVDRVVGQPGNPAKRLRGKVLRVTESPRYSAVCLYHNSPTRRGETIRVHVLVAAAFLGERPKDYEVCHNNGDSHDNRLSNLRYDTRSANQQDRWLHGTARPVPKTHCSNGHEYTPNNVYFDAGYRKCLTCRRARGLKASAKRSLRRRSLVNVQ